jgi:two-component system, OmpR family, phosphate regulon sensor histidine kinase PhoR
VLDGEALAARFRRTTRLMQADIARLVHATRGEQHATYVRALGALGIVGLLAFAIATTLLVKVPEQLRLLYAAEEDARLQAEEGANASRALAHVSDAVMMVDTNGRTRSWNEAAERLFDVAAARALGRPAARIIPGYADLLDGAERENAFVLVTIGGTERWLAPSRSEFDGGSVLTVHDATAAYLLERARSDFIATASHELRTPLTTIYGGVRTLIARRDELGQEDRDRLLRLVEQESAQLAKIVDQLLVSTNLDRGTLSVHESDLDVRGLCEEVVEAARTRAPSGIALELHAPEPPVALRCDGPLLRQVLVNLVENAVKYSYGGGRVDVWLVDEPGQVRIEVRDRGRGIPASEQEWIFEKFYRLDVAMESGVGGSGLGLYIARAIVTELGGTLSVRSIAGAGATFTVALPRASAPARRQNVA